MFEKIYEEIFKIDPKIRYIGITKETKNGAGLNRTVHI